MELNSHIALDIKAEIDIKSTYNIATVVNKLRPTNGVTKEMRVGVMPVDFCSPTGNGRNFTEPKRGIVTTHGYCAGLNYWTQSKEFSGNVCHFEDLKQNRRISEFADLLLTFAEQNQFTHFSIIGHSQGGLAALHIHNYLFSGIDCAENGRLLQSVGTPYKGNSGAGAASNFIKIFRISCGSNLDLTKSVAALWLKDIDLISKQNVYFYRTNYPSGFFEFCKLATQLVLEKPNDGLAENSLAFLDEGHDMGIKLEWCHSGDMKYPPQCSDPERNKEMNLLAAR